MRPLVLLGWLAALATLGGCVDLDQPPRLSPCPGPGCPGDGGAGRPETGAPAPLDAAPEAAPTPAPDGPPSPRADAAGAPADAPAGPADAPAAERPAPPPDGPAEPAPPPPDVRAGPPPDAAAPPPDAAAPAAPDRSRFGFERDTHGWTTLRGPPATHARSGAVTFAGEGALEVGLDFTTMENKETYSGVKADTVSAPPSAGTTVTYRLWVPQGHGLTSAQPYLLYRNAATVDGRWAGTTRWLLDQRGGQWYTVTVTVPAESVQLYEIGVEWKPARAWAGKVYVDAVDW